MALWMTNRERLWRFVQQELLSHWGLEIAATWAWLKVSASGQMLGRLVCPGVALCEDRHHTCMDHMQHVRGLGWTMVLLQQGPRLSAQWTWVGGWGG